MITLTHYLVLTGILFSIGLVGVMRRTNLLMLFLQVVMFKSFSVDVSNVTASTRISNNKSMNG